MDKTLLEINNFCLDIPLAGRKVSVLQGIDLKINKGESVAITGSSGSGKSLLALSIIGLIPDYLEAESRGVISMYHEDANTSNPFIQGQPGWRSFWRRKTGMVFQDPLACFNPLMTCGEQIAEVLVSGNKMNRTDAKTETLAFMQKSGLENPASLYQAFPHQLSGGQLQRMLVAMALIGQPALLIADEPSSNLDQQHKGELIRLIKRMQKEFHISLIYITHDPEEAKEISDRILIMKDGKLYENIDLITKSGLSGGSGNDILYSPGKPASKVERHSDVPLIAISALTKQFTRKNFWGRVKSRETVLEDVCLQIQRNETVGLIGASGSGKSTLGRLILGLEQPDKGQIMIYGQDLFQLTGRNRKETRKKIQIVYQNPYNTLNPRMHILSLVKEPLEVHELIKNNNERNDKARQLLLECGIPENLHRHYTFQLSGGQRQRVAIARAMILEPEFVVLDECVSSLDVASKAGILDLLNVFKSNIGVAYLFISHEEKLVKRFSDRIYVLKDGHLSAVD